MSAQIEMPNAAGSALDGSLWFGEYCLDAKRRTLIRAGREIRITPRSFKVLFYLAEQRHRAVGKDELLDVVWEHRGSEGALRQEMFNLRRALRTGGSQTLVRTVSKFGYRFEEPSASSQSPPLEQIHRLSEPISASTLAALRHVALGGLNNVARAIHLIERGDTDIWASFPALTALAECWLQLGVRGAISIEFANEKVDAYIAGLDRLLSFHVGTESLRSRSTAMLKKRPRVALNQLEGLLADDAGRAVVHRAMGDTHVMLRDLRAALHSSTIAANLDPLNVAASLALARIYVLLGDLDAAATLLRGLNDLHPANIDSLVALCDIETLNGNYAFAIDALSGLDADPAALSVLCVAHALRGDTVQARHFRQRLIGYKDATTYNSAYLLAKCSLAIGNVDMALAALREGTDEPTLANIDRDPWFIRLHNCMDFKRVVRATIL